MNPLNIEFLTACALLIQNCNLNPQCTVAFRIKQTGTVPNRFVQNYYVRFSFYGSSEDALCTELLLSSFDQILISHLLYEVSLSMTGKMANKGPQLTLFDRKWFQTSFLEILRVHPVESRAQLFLQIINSKSLLPDPFQFRQFVQCEPQDMEPRLNGIPMNSCEFHLKFHHLRFTLQYGKQTEQ